MIIDSLYKRLAIFFLRKIFFLKFFRNLFITFLKNHRYAVQPDPTIAREGYEITFIPIIKKNTLPDKYLTKISDEAHNILIDDFNKNTANVYSNHDEINDLSNHYLLLKAISESIKAKNIVEIGTASGMSLSSFINSKYTQKVFTWDLCSLYHPTKSAVGLWFQKESTKNFITDNLKSNSNKFEQYVEDINNPIIFNTRKQILENADLIFIDGPHDGIFEREIFSKLLRLKFKNNPIMILDDIKISSMVSFWHEIELPKLDISHMGHITGTGIIKLN